MSARKRHWSELAPGGPRTEDEWLAAVKYAAFAYIDVPEEIKTVEMALIAVAEYAVLLRCVPDRHLKTAKAGLKLLGIRNKENEK